MKPALWISALAAAAVTVIAQGKSPDDIYSLAELNFYGNATHPRNYDEAFYRYSQLARLGVSSAQYMLGFMWATGIGGVVMNDTDLSQAMALLMHTYAALNGDTRSEMTVASRYHTGIGTPRDCEKACFYYKKAATKAIEDYRSGPPGGKTMSKIGYRLADDAGGVYGEGASVSSSGMNAVQAGPESHGAIDDVMEYLDLMSRKGDLKATFSLGRMTYEGGRTMERSFKRARVYFSMVTRKYWTNDGKVIAGNHPGIERLASKAAGYLGRMYLRGEGLETNYERALLWFRRGVTNGDALCQYGMGLMYQDGLGVPEDVLKAAEYFKVSAEQDYAPAQVKIGELLLDQGDVQIATRYFELASRHGDIEAFFYLAEIADRGMGREKSCGVASAYYKIVAEKAEEIHSPFAAANQAYTNGDIESALVFYMMAAEQGYEVGQANVAYLLDEEKSRLPLHFFRKRRSPMLRNPRLALIHWTRSAKQSNIDSMVKMGDYYLKGVGTEADNEKAAACYQAAAEYQQSAQALWNLGWMHENGIGVQQDFHLAKRYYDQALETNQEAYLPVTLSLLKLRLRSFWNTITNGRVKSIQSEPEPKQEWSFGEWVSNFLQDDQLYDHELDEAEDEIMESGHEQIHGSQDIYGDLLDDGIIESLIIVGLAAALAFLVYYRQQRQLNNINNNNQQQQQQQQQPAEQRQGQPAERNHHQPAAAAAGGGDGGQGDEPPRQEERNPQHAPPPPVHQERGLFPVPGDPDYGQWVAGGVAH
ncbi:MAG: ERAD-associated protein [Peltula sp. TS41687]|nr:MAG: ERAD-associated protein [Peltula sp. TS41687]